MTEFSTDFNDTVATEQMATVNLEPWSIEGAHPTGADRIKNIYEGILEWEARPPHPDDQIVVGKIAIGSDEYGLFVANGLDSDDKRLQNTYRPVFTRQELLSNGFAFVNRLGDGEKGLVSGSFADPDDPSTTLDFTNRALLTHEELDKVYRHQLKHPERFGLAGHDLGSVRKDMLLFLLTGVTDKTFTNADEMRRQTLPFSTTGYLWQTGSKEERVLAQRYWSARVSQVRKTSEAKSNIEALAIAQQSFLEEQGLLTTAEGVDLVGATGWSQLGNSKILRSNIQVGHMGPVRLRKLNGQASPFLESGFAFAGNPDLLVAIPNPDKPEQTMPLRLNMAVLHLAAGHPKYPGFSEMGQADWDQRYMTVGEYVRSVYPTGPSAKDIWLEELIQLGQPTRDEIALNIQERVLEVAATTKLPKFQRKIDLEPNSKRQFTAQHAARLIRSTLRR